MALHAIPPPSLVRMGAWADLPTRGARNGSLVGAPNALNCRDAYGIPFTGHAAGSASPVGVTRAVRLRPTQTVEMTWWLAMRS